VEAAGFEVQHQRTFGAREAHDETGQSLWREGLEEGAVERL